MESLRRVLQQAEGNKVAVGHFNISDLVALKAVFDGARDLKVPVVVRVSEGEREFTGVRQISAMAKSLRDEFAFPIFLNADHTHSLRSAVGAAKAGLDWVVFDVSTLPFEENVRQTKAAVEALRAIRPDRRFRKAGGEGAIGVIQRCEPRASRCGVGNMPDAAMADIAHTAHDAEKEAAARASLRFVHDGAIVGLGSGSTAADVVRLLGERVRAGLRIRGVLTSRHTGELATAVGIPLATFDQ